MIKAEMVKKIKGLSEYAKKEGWVFTFDKDESTFFYGPRTIPDDAKLFSVNDEFSVYLSAQHQLRGVVLEYYACNFVEHHEEFKGLFEKIFKSHKDEEVVVDPKNKKNSDIGVFQALFERTLIAEAVGAKIHS